MHPKPAWPSRLPSRFLSSQGGRDSVSKNLWWAYPAKLPNTARPHRRADPTRQLLPLTALCSLRGQEWSGACKGILTQLWENPSRFYEA